MKKENLIIKDCKKDYLDINLKPSKLNAKNLLF